MLGKTQLAKGRVYLLHHFHAYVDCSVSLVGIWAVIASVTLCMSPEDPWKIGMAFDRIADPPFFQEEPTSLVFLVDDGGF